MIIMKNPRVDLNTKALCEARCDVHRTDTFILRNTFSILEDGASWIGKIALEDISQLGDPVLWNPLRSAVVARPDFIAITKIKQ